MSTFRSNSGDDAAEPQAVKTAPGHGADSGRAPLLYLRGVTKSYSGVEVLREIDLDVYPGSVHALVGENGAGKSTLCKIIAGLLLPDKGQIVFQGENVVFNTPATARNAGISYVPQELSIVPERSLAENILMGGLPARAGFVDRTALRRRCQEILEKLSLSVDPLAKARSFGPGMQQLIMIARGLSLDAKLFILDEPTAALTDSEIEHLFQVIDTNKQLGSAFLYISHRLDEVAAITDEVTVLRDGRKVLNQPTVSIGRQDLIRAMVGRRIERFFEGEADAIVGDTPRGLGGPVTAAADGGTRALEVRNVSRGVHLRNVSFSVDRGEVVGIAGLLGAGRTELLRCVFGIDRIDEGEIELNGEQVRIRSPRDAIGRGVVLLPEERKSQGLVLGLSVGTNIVAPHLSRFAHRGLVSKAEIRAAASGVVEKLGIKTRSVDLPVQHLSGGNQQKVVIGRWVLFGAGVYLLDEPTRGVDVGAKADIYAAIRELTLAGSAVVVVSSELPELLGLCDRILVMRNGRIVTEVQRDEFSEERILAAAMGHEEALTA